MSTITKALTKIYYDPQHPAAFGSVEKLYFAAKQKKVKNLTRKRVLNFLEHQDTFTLHRPVRRKFLRRKTIARHLDEIWVADLIEMQAIKNENSGFRYILTVIDILSRYAFAIPIKSKTGPHIVNAFKQIFKKFKRKPEKLHTDKGSEFYNKTFANYLREEKIKLYSTESDMKAAVVERFNRTLKEKMFKYFTSRKTLHFLRVLPKLISAYNSRIHGAHKMKPNIVSKKNERLAWDRLYGEYIHRSSPAKTALQIGDTIRLSKLPSKFRKAYLKGWTSEIFFIKNVLDTIPKTYKVSDAQGETLKGSFYYEELNRVRL